MGASAEEVKSHLKVYWAVFFGLLAMTAVTVGASYLHVPIHWALILCLIIASIKGTLVAGYFMHLIGEKKIIYAILALTIFFFFFCLLIPVIVESESTANPGSWNP